MTKRNQDFDMHIGESKTIFIKLDNEDGSSFNPAGSTMEWWLAKTSHSPKILQKTIGSGLVLSEGGVNVILDSADTYDLKPEIYYHELKIMLGSTGLSVATVGAAFLRHALDMREVPEEQQILGIVVTGPPVESGGLIPGRPPVRNTVIPQRPTDPRDVVKVQINQTVGMEGKTVYRRKVTTR